MPDEPRPPTPEQIAEAQAAMNRTRAMTEQIKDNTAVHQPPLDQSIADLDPAKVIDWQDKEGFEAKQEVTREDAAARYKEQQERDIEPTKD